MHGVVRMAVNPAQPLDCPGCSRLRLLRPDSGLCEVCTARTPRALANWQNTRDEASRRAYVRSLGVSEDTCLLCLRAYRPLSAHGHARVCQAKPHACEVCGHRFGTEYELRGHMREAKGHGSSS